jgi:hypothetical protein
MQFLGDLERFAATSLYPWRYAIAAAVVAGVLGILVLAIRRGWLAAARRHPGRTVALGAVMAVVLAPAAWYFGSPLFIRTELVESAPAALVEPPPAASASPAATTTPSTTPSARPTEAGESPSTGPGPEATPSTTPSPAPAPLVRTGAFAGADDFHFGRGKVTLVEAPDGNHTLRFEDFSVRNGPDLFVYLSPDPTGWTKDAVGLGRLRATDGSFNTPIPAGTDLGDVKSVVIWCKEFAVLFAVAALDG